MPRPPRIVLVAGEASGDQLAAGLIEALRQRHPECELAGIAGPAMRQAGCEVWFEARELAVMGLAEVLAHLPRIYRLRGQLLRRIEAFEPDLFIGIDAPDFNLGVERKLKAQGIRTVHYVSPSVWAWRQKRVRKIHRSVDRVLCLFPFEPEFYRQHGVDARFVGHPMADEIPLDNDPRQARQSLGLETDQTYIALLPGSRLGEVERLAETMLTSAGQILAKRPGIQFLVPLANPEVGAAFRSRIPAGLPLHCYAGRMREVLTAADVALVASGTATLETLLVGRPMVVCYKLAALTYFLADRFKLIKSPWYSLPNILAGEELVPELIQADASPERLAPAVLAWLEDAERADTVKARFRQIHRQLRGGASQQAAAAVTELLA